MADEHIDVLDEDGNKTGKTAPRSEIFSLGLWHATIHIWIINSNREVLLQKRSLHKKTYAGLMTMSVTGTVDSGETPENTAIRELEEELGISSTGEQLIKICVQKVNVIIPETLDHDNEFIHVYILYRDMPINDIKIQVEEVDSVMWRSWESFKNDILDPILSRKYINIPNGYYPEVIKKIEENMMARAQ